MNEQLKSQASIASAPHAVLGVTADAPLTLVDRIYWKRAHDLGEAQRRGDLVARARMEELNAAHAQLREAAAPDLVPVSANSERGAHRGAALAVLATSLAATGVVGAVYGMVAGGAVFAGGAVATLFVGMRAAAPAAMSEDAAQADALATLFLAPGAAADEIQLAYDVLRDTTLAGGSDRDPEVLARLARLQSAYHSALPSGGAAYRRG